MSPTSYLTAPPRIPTIEPVGAICQEFFRERNGIGDTGPYGWEAQIKKGYVALAFFVGQKGQAFLLSVYERLAGRQQLS